MVFQWMALVQSQNVSHSLRLSRIRVFRPFDDGGFQFSRSARQTVCRKIWRDSNSIPRKEHIGHFHAPADRRHTRVCGVGRSRGCDTVLGHAAAYHRRSTQGFAISTASSAPPLAGGYRISPTFDIVAAVAKGHRGTRSVGAIASSHGVQLARIASPKSGFSSRATPHHQATAIADRSTRRRRLFEPERTRCSASVAPGARPRRAGRTA